MTSDVTKLLKDTSAVVMFGTSIPISDLPGIGASTLTDPVGDAKANAISFCKLVTLAILVTDEISNAYCVTAGPKLTSATRVLMPKFASVNVKTCYLAIKRPPSAGVAG